MCAYALHTAPVQASGTTPGCSLSLASTETMRGITETEKVTLKGESGKRAVGSVQFPRCYMIGMCIRYKYGERERARDAYYLIKVIHAATLPSSKLSGIIPT